MYGRARRAGWPRRPLAGWSALIAGAAAAGVWRGLVTARMVEAGPAGWVLYGVAGAAFGAVWGLVLGWLTGVAALAAADSGQPRSATGSGPGGD